MNHKSIRPDSLSDSRHATQSANVKPIRLVLMKIHYDYPLPLLYYSPSVLILPKDKFDISML